MASLNAMVKKVAGLADTRDVSDWENQFIKSVRENVTPGTSALFVMTSNVEGLFTPGADYLVADSPARMRAHMAAIKADAGLRRQPGQQLGGVGRIEHFGHGVARFEAARVLRAGEQVNVVIAKDRRRALRLLACVAQTGL